MRAVRGVRAPRWSRARGEGDTAFFRAGGGEDPKSKGEQGRERGTLPRSPPGIRGGNCAGEIGTPGGVDQGVRQGDQGRETRGHCFVPGRGHATGHFRRGTSGGTSGDTILFRAGEVYKGEAHRVHREYTGDTVSCGPGGQKTGSSEVNGGGAKAGKVGTLPCPPPCPPLVLPSPCPPLPCPPPSSLVFALSPCASSPCAQWENRAV